MRESREESRRSTQPLRLVASIAGLMVALAGCADKPRGACTFGAGCTDDEFASRCHLVNGRFFEGLTCGDLGYGSPSNHSSSLGLRRFHLTFSDVSRPDRHVTIGSAVVTDLVPATNVTRITGTSPIRLETRRVLGLDQHSTAVVDGGRCSPDLMPVVLQVETGNWMLRLEPDDGLVTVILEDGGAKHEMVFRTNESPNGDIASPRHIAFTGTLDTWYRVHEGASCVVGGDDVAIILDIIEY